ncbi:MAG: hypothetical protein JSS75_00330 [Bacteroidetes bacterium]|nr:hypothetical protein [Bacteroidota bacterium]
MKTIFTTMNRFAKFTSVAILFAALAVFTSSCAPSTDSEAPTSIGVQKNAVTSTTATYTETVNNKSSEFVNFTLNLADNSQFFYGSAPYTNVGVITPASVVGVMANGKNIPINTPTVVTMSDGKNVTVTWDPTTNAIVVVDTLEMN